MSFIDLNNILKGESKFSTRFGKLIQEATQLEESHGGKYQITSYPPGVGYKSHTDCTLNSEEARDRYATFLVYLNDLGADGGGETTFPGKFELLTIQIKYIQNFNLFRYLDIRSRIKEN